MPSEITHRRSKSWKDLRVSNHKVPFWYRARCLFTEVMSLTMNVPSKIWDVDHQFAPGDWFSCSYITAKSNSSVVRKRRAKILTRKMMISGIVLLRNSSTYGTNEGLASMPFHIYVKQQDLFLNAEAVERTIKTYRIIHKWSHSTMSTSHRL